MKKRITQDDYIKANRKASREAEIEMYGHPICHKRVHQSKKVYNRKKIKAANKELPYFLSFSKGIFQYSGWISDNPKRVLIIRKRSLTI
ncbi:hypothetical protein [uncultured Bacteroides sp.]|uniref:hypothetical protein n=1 Tax=uncultured Bacteroides sp. TaxID=162156 RepID=UPI0027DAC0DC|nr:hypothetical protein [uncultured Bacteroides sp.]